MQRSVGAASCQPLSNLLFFFYYKQFLRDILMGNIKSRMPLSIFNVQVSAVCVLNLFRNLSAKHAVVFLKLECNLVSGCKIVFLPLSLLTKADKNPMLSCQKQLELKIQLKRERLLGALRPSRY